MDMVECRDRLKRLVERSKEKAVEQINVPPANKLLATVKNRIMVDGERTDGKKIGQYSTDPMYASRDQFDKTSAFKPGKKAFIATSQKLGKFNTKTNSFGKGKITQRVEKEKMKTMYLVEGYKELRDIQGKPTDKINLNYSGDLMASYQQQVKIGVIMQGLISETEALKRDGLENGTKNKTGFGKIFTPKQSEIDQYKKEVAEAEKDMVLKTLKGA